MRRHRNAKIVSKMSKKTSRKLYILEAYRSSVTRLQRCFWQAEKIIKCIEGWAFQDWTFHQNKQLKR